MKPISLEVSSGDKVWSLDRYHTTLISQHAEFVGWIGEAGAVLVA